MRLHEIAHVENVSRLLIGRVARTVAPLDRRDWFRLLDHAAADADVADYLGVLAFGDANAGGVPIARGLRQLTYLDDGDVVAVDPNGFVRVLYRRSSPH